jgi:hypothetical protein
VRSSCAPSLAILRESGMQWAIGFVNTPAVGNIHEGNPIQASALICESVALFRNSRPMEASPRY